jgi:hypothetical protein
MKNAVLVKLVRRGCGQCCGSVIISFGSGSAEPSRSPDIQIQEAN